MAYLVFADEHGCALCVHHLALALRGDLRNAMGTAELGLGGLARLDEAIPELRAIAPEPETIAPQLPDETPGPLAEWHTQEI